jgi:hypothetical protein
MNDQMIVKAGVQVNRCQSACPSAGFGVKSQAKHGHQFGRLMFWGVATVGWSKNDKNKNHKICF